MNKPKLKLLIFLALGVLLLIPGILIPTGILMTELKLSNSLSVKMGVIIEFIVFYFGFCSPSILFLVLGILEWKNLKVGSDQQLSKYQIEEKIQNDLLAMQSLLVIASSLLIGSFTLIGFNLRMRCLNFCNTRFIGTIINSFILIFPALLFYFLSWSIYKKIKLNKEKLKKMP